MVSATKAALPLMRAQGGGRIVNISSVAAPLAIPFQAWYSVSKAAVNAYTLALFNEVKQFGISVCAVMPGDIRTGFTSAREKSHAGDDVYKGRIARSVAKMEKDEENGMAPEVAGRFLAPRGAEKARQALLRHRAFLQVFRAALAHSPHPPHRLAAGASVRGGMTFRQGKAGRCARPVRALTKPTTAKIAPMKKKSEAIFASCVSCTCIPAVTYVHVSSLGCKYSFLGLQAFSTLCQSVDFVNILAGRCARPVFFFCVADKNY